VVLAFKDNMTFVGNNPITAKKMIGRNTIDQANFKYLDCEVLVWKINML
jgi:hypothetical protein